jgi:hypothetical protein
MCLYLWILFIAWNTPDKHFGWHANLAYGYFMYDSIFQLEFVEDLDRLSYFGKL